MKILLPSKTRQQNGQRGFVAVIVMMILLGLVLTFITANLLALSTLHGDMKVVEKKQLQRLANTSASRTPASPNLTGTNSPALSK